MATHSLAPAGWYQRADGTRGYWNGTSWLDAASTRHPAPLVGAATVNRIISRVAQRGSASGRPSGYGQNAGSGPTVVPGGPPAPSLGQNYGSGMPARAARSSARTPAQGGGTGSRLLLPIIFVLGLVLVIVLSAVSGD